MLILSYSLSRGTVVSIIFDAQTVYLKLVLGPKSASWSPPDWHTFNFLSCR